MTSEIVQVVQELSKAGGAESVAFELARVFSRNGISNLVLASSVDDALAGNIKVERIAPWLATIPTRGFWRYIGRAIVVPLFAIAATIALRQHQHSVVISHGDSFKGDVLVVHAVNSQSLSEKRNAGSWSWLLNPMHLWVNLRDRWMIGGLRYRLFVAVSRRVATELQNLYSVPMSRIRIIPNGIDLERFRPDSTKGRSIREEFGIPPSAKLLLFVGHEFGRKGLAYAIAALEKLDTDVWLLVVGSDNPAPYKKLAQKSRDRLIFAGARSDLPSFYTASDAFVLPTAYETFSLVCMEAMACSLPVFAASAGGIEDYLRDGVNGYSIKLDGEDIAEKLRTSLGDQTLMQTLRSGARATALAYSWDKIAIQYIDLLHEIEVSKRGMAETSKSLPA